MAVDGLAADHEQARDLVARMALGDLKLHLGRWSTELILSAARSVGAELDPAKPMALDVAAVAGP